MILGVLIFPRARIHTLVIFFFITFIELPASFVLLAWFVLQLFSGVGELGRQVGGGVAYGARVGGFVLGSRSPATLPIWAEDDGPPTTTAIPVPI